jgi:hypothetical protein
MARTRTPGIRMDRNGGRIIDKEKEHRGKGTGKWLRWGYTSPNEKGLHRCKPLNRWRAR